MPAGALRIIIDTNVLVGGLLMKDAADPLARFVAAVQVGAVAIAASAALLAEYREVLLRPKIVARHGLAESGVDTVVAAVARHATVLSPPKGPPAPDAGDQMLWDLLAADPHLRLITADKALLRDRGMRGRVTTALAFIGEPPWSAGTFVASAERTP